MTLPVIIAKYVRSGWLLIDETDTSATLKKHYLPRAPFFFLVALFLLLAVMVNPMFGVVLLLLGSAAYLIGRRLHHTLQARVEPDGTICVESSMSRLNYTYNPRHTEEIRL